MLQKEYEKEYYYKELKIKKRIFLYITTGIGIVEVVEVISHCLVHQ